MAFNFPAICIDDFYPNVDTVREFALAQEYEPSDGGFWPGERTRHIHELNPEFFDFFTQRVMSVFYNFTSEDVTWNISSHFQRFPPYSNDNTSLTNVGWTHRDTALFAGVIYLTPNPNPNSGTSIFHAKKDILPRKLTHDLRFDLHTGKGVDEEAYANMMRENDSLFEETITFKNRYNRLVAYDASNFHKANSYVQGEQERLIQVFFVNSLKADCLPLHRWNHNLL